MKIELEYIEKLVKLVSENELSEITLEEGEKAISVRKDKIIMPAHVAAGSQPAALPVQATTSTKEEKSKKEVQAGERTNLTKITSPMVGTFYRASSPGSTPFTEVGKSVSAGQVVCIIEAMKMMNEIQAEVAGRVVEVCVQDGEPVEYGQVLMLVEQ